MKFVCPRCRAELQKKSETELHCLQDGLTFEQKDGTWRFLLPERKSYYSRFIADYETIRRAEGRFSTDTSYYRSLPFKDTSGYFSADWKIRAASYRALESRILPDSHQYILDMGAGNGWLSNRLSALGHDVIAVDLLVNPEDGLGAWRNYENPFVPIQSEFTRLPIPNNSISMVIFNASFHYSENYEASLSEALRILLQDGKIIIMDSPVYHDAKSGEQMVAERKAVFISRYGFASNSIESENYLTYQRMGGLSEKFGVHWRHIQPFYGVRWAIRPWLARLRGARESAQFGLWIGTRRNRD
jgi:SAM-dependent methyltransferase